MGERDCLKARGRICFERTKGTFVVAEKTGLAHSYLAFHYQKIFRQNLYSRNRCQQSMGLIAVVGGLSLLIGLLLLALEIKEKGSIETEFGKFTGPVWFILIALGIILMAIGS
ncbi:MAG: hypothetical protein QXU11_08105 [Thermoproteota archaeon]